jgi:alpha-glucosidase
VPIPWEADGPSFGFGAVAGWLPQPPEFGPLAASNQEHDPESTLALYRGALALRRQRLVGERGFDLVDGGPDVLAFDRGDHFRCVANMGDSTIPLPDGDVVMASGSFDDTGLPPDTAVWVAR